MKNHPLNDWEKSLKNKIEAPLSQDFDKKFWARFDQEFSQKNEKTTWFSFNFLILFQKHRFLSAAFALMIVSMASFYSYKQFDQPKQVEIAQMVDLAPALSSLDIYQELETLDLTEEEWKILNGEEVI